jgi:hypothetical protein
MPFATNDDLPSSIRQHLPEHAQDIFRVVFNNAWSPYAAPRVAWATSSIGTEKPAIAFELDQGCVPRSSLDFFAIDVFKRGDPL